MDRSKTSRRAGTTDSAVSPTPHPSTTIPRRTSTTTTSPGPLAAADALGLPVLSWTVPTTVATTLNKEYSAGFTGHDPADIDLVVTLDRTRQLAAVACHPSQAVPGSLLWRRLEIQGDFENLRWLTPHPDHQKDVTNS